MPDEAHGAALGQQAHFVDVTIPMTVEMRWRKAIARSEGSAESGR
jgi:hypothetical protein